MVSPTRCRGHLHEPSPEQCAVQYPLWRPCGCGVQEGMPSGGRVLAGAMRRSHEFSAWMGRLLVLPTMLATGHV